MVSLTTMCLFPASPLRKPLQKLVELRFKQRGDRLEIGTAGFQWTVKG